MISSFPLAGIIFPYPIGFDSIFEIYQSQ
jgi:hypothetical protein